MWRRLLAGSVPGFSLAALICGLLAYLPPGNWQQLWVPSLLLFFPLWLGLTGWALAQKPQKSLIWLGIAHGVLVPFFLVVKHLHLVG